MRHLQLALGWLAVTAALPLAVAGVIFLGDDYLEPDVKFFRWELDPDWLGGPLLAGAGILGAIGLAAIALPRPPRRWNALTHCPRCGRLVTAGSPTCLSCGENLFAR